MIADRIKTLRQAKGFTQKKLAKTVGVTAAAVQQWENGSTKNIRNSYLWKLAQALGTSPDFLLFGQVSASDTGSLSRNDRRVAAKMGRRLRKERLAADLSQSDLATLAQVAPSTVGNWEQGTRKISVEAATALERALNLPAAFFLLLLDRHEAEIIAALRVTKQRNQS